MDVAAHSLACIVGITQCTLAGNSMLCCGPKCCEPASLPHCLLLFAVALAFLLARVQSARKKEAALKSTGTGDGIQDSEKSMFTMMHKLSAHLT